MSLTENKNLAGPYFVYVTPTMYLAILFKKKKKKIFYMGWPML